MVHFSSLALLAVAMLIPFGLADILRDPKTSCTTFTQLITTTETRFPTEIQTSIVLYEYPVVTTVYATNTSTILYTADSTRIRTRTDTETVSACTVY